MSADRLIEQLLDHDGARTLGILELLHCAEVRYDAGIPTAAVTMQAPPSLLLNEAWVAAHCPTPEHLGMLLLHELLHIGLGHTRQAHRSTPLDNVAFDVIINALLAAMVRERQDCQRWLALLKETQPADVSPWFLLRPPPRWPDRSDWTASEGAPEPLRALHKRLYGRDASPLTVTAAEVRALLRQAHGGDGALAESESYGNLLGTHDRTDGERALDTPLREQELAALARRSLRAVREGVRGAGTGHDLRTITWSPVRPEARLVAVLDEAIDRTAAAIGRRRRQTQDQGEQLSADVRWHRDRRALARLALAAHFGAPTPLFFEHPVTSRRQVPMPAAGHIYLDVSGSMSHALALVAACLVRTRDFKGATLHAFSTQVVPLAHADLERGSVTSDGGTRVSACLEHAIEKAGARSAVLIITDGFVEPVEPKLAAALRRAEITAHVLLTERGAQPMPWAASVTRLSTPISDLVS